MVKKVINADTGTADLVGGDDWDIVADTINGTTAFTEGVKLTVEKYLHFGDRMQMYEKAGSNGVQLTSNLGTGGPVFFGVWPNTPTGLGNGSTISAFYTFASQFGGDDSTAYDVFQVQAVKTSDTPGEGAARYDLVSFKNLTGYLHPIYIGMQGFNKWIFNTDGSINANSLLVSGFKLGAIMDANDNAITNVNSYRGVSTANTAMRANPNSSDATERSLVLQALNASTDTFIDVLTITPGGASPKATMSRPIKTAGLQTANVAKTFSDTGYTLTVTDQVIGVDGSGGATSMVLPTAVGIEGQTFTIRRTDILESSFLLTISTTSSQTIGGAPAEYLTPGDCIVVESDNANWRVLARTPGFSQYQKGATANRRYIAGALPGMTPTLLTTTTLPALDTLWALPLIVEKTTKFDNISFRITTVAGAGGVAMAGIYRDTGNCYPGALVFETGSIDITTGTIKDTGITSGLQVFPPGMYWLAWQCRVAAPQMKGLNGTANLMNPFGSATLSNNSEAYGLSVANASNTLPNPYTAAATLLNTAPAVGVPVPAIGLRPI